MPGGGPKYVRVVVDFTVDEFVEYERAENCIRSKLRRRARRAVVVLEMARRAVAGASEEARIRSQVVVHTDPSLERAWYETDRGILPVPTEALEQALAQGEISLVPETRTNAEKVSLGKSAQGIGRQTLRALMARSGGRCEVCSRTGLLQIHHRKARSRGGGHELENLEFRCLDCHDFVHEEDYRSEPTWRNARSRKRARNQRADDG